MRRESGEGLQLAGVMGRLLGGSARPSVPSLSHVLWLCRQPVPAEAPLGQDARGQLPLPASPALPQNRHPTPGVWAHILQGPLRAWNAFEVSRLIFKTHASCALCFITFEYLLSV